MNGVGGYEPANRPTERVHCTPVGTLFFVLVFVALGLITLVVAMSRGRLVVQSPDAA